jgi:hypothetical protein
MVMTDVIISAMNAFNDTDKGDQEQADMGQSGAEASTAEEQSRKVTRRYSDKPLLELQ